jgi:DNA-binding MarR family transcriptional regulator
VSYAERKAADRRLNLLELLVVAGGSANEGVLEQGLIDLGERVGVDQNEVRRLLGGLSQGGLIETEFFQDRVMVARITRRGVAVSEGRITVDGVSRPQLGV